ncbi:MAG TPA: hypothetical protein VFR97_13855 [Capillimicrobium sp.]|nr:hypothetical protein [Capillimicrobium sp.]
MIRPARSLATALTALVALGAPAVAGAAAPTTTPTAHAAGHFPKAVVATQRHGVRLIAGLDVGRRGVSTLADVREVWGAPRSQRRDGEGCDTAWGHGLHLLFVSFGGPIPCGERFLQTATIRGRGWNVIVGDERYRIGQRRSAIPAHAKRIRGWGGGGYQLASMPFLGRRTLSVLAHVGGAGRIDRFVLFIGKAGD